MNIVDTRKNIYYMQVDSVTKPQTARITGKIVHLVETPELMRIFSLRDRLS